MRAALSLVVLFVALASASAVLEQSAVESKCQIADQTCLKDAQCCGGLKCNTKSAKCERICTKANQACTKHEDCCSATCNQGHCTCFEQGATCTWGSECCDGSCSAAKGCCRKSGTACTADANCCSGICEVLAGSGNPKKQCVSDFGQKCSATEPCKPPNYCSDLLGMCTLAVKAQ